MKELNYEAMNDTQITEVNGLLKGRGKTAAMGVGVVSLITGLGYLGVKGYRKWKDNKETKKEKPAYDFMHV